MRKDPRVIEIPDIIGQALESDPDFPGKNAQRLQERAHNEWLANDGDLEGMCKEDLREEIKRLRAGIRAHRDATGHNLCWYVPELWGLLPEKVTPKPEVPETEEFLRCCAAYRASLQK